MTPRNLPASVHDRLLQLSRDRDMDFNLLLQRYAAERFLYRLGESRFRNAFTLKGAMLFAFWSGQAYRATRDLDLLGQGSGNPADVAGVVREICAVQVPDDGLEFQPDTIRVNSIRGATDEGGVRLLLVARLGTARVTLQVDVGFGDSLVPPAAEIVFPVLLDGPEPRILAYSRESVVAEKFHAMVSLGLANSRMKDFYDLLTLSRSFSFEGQRLVLAVAATFKSRQTQIPSAVPDSLTPAFYEEPGKVQQWKAYLTKGDLTDVPTDFASVGKSLRLFLPPVLEAASSRNAFDVTWPAGGPWR
ncbi:MAG: nucleotidyl transferase AbiEii/AbiGii toxin family protein [Candidatus Coatesbacteria bacterium]